MAGGLDLYDTQITILERIEDQVPQRVFLADVLQASELAATHGVDKPFLVVQFSDLLPSARDKSFCGSLSDGYYSIFRVVSVARDPRQSLQVSQKAHEALLGWSAPNVANVQKDAGGGSFNIKQTNTNPAFYGMYSAFRYSTNVANVGEW